MAYNPSAEKLTQLGFSLMVPTIQGSAVIIWEDGNGRRILFTGGLSEFLYEERTLAGFREKARLYRPESDIEFEQQLQSLGWI